MRLLTTKEISDILKIEPQCIRQKIRKHRIPHFRIGNRIRVELDEVLKKLKNGQKQEIPNLSGQGSLGSTTNLPDGPTTGHEHHGSDWKWKTVLLGRLELGSLTIE